MTDNDKKSRAEDSADGIALPPFLTALLRQAKTDPAVNAVPESLLGGWGDFETEGKKI